MAYAVHEVINGVLNETAKLYGERQYEYSDLEAIGVSVTMSHRHSLRVKIISVARITTESTSPREINRLNIRQTPWLPAFARNAGNSRRFDRSCSGYLRKETDNVRIRTNI